LFNDPSWKNFKLEANGLFAPPFFGQYLYLITHSNTKAKQNQLKKEVFIWNQSQNKTSSKVLINELNHKKQNVMNASIKTWKTSLKLYQTLAFVPANWHQSTQMQC
jgi:hypothetical protein